MDRGQMAEEKRGRMGEEKRGRMAKEKRGRMGNETEAGEMVHRYTLLPYDMSLSEEQNLNLVQTQTKATCQRQVKSKGEAV